MNQKPIHVGKLRLDPALDEPKGVERDLRIASSNHLVVLCTEDFLRDPSRLRDVEIAKVHGHAVTVLLHPPTIEYPPDLFPPYARFIPATNLTESLHNLMKELM